MPLGPNEDLERTVEGKPKMVLIVDVPQEPKESEEPKDGNKEIKG